MKIKWLGHASFRVEAAGKTLYFDPFVLPDKSPKADIILVTHEHFDHCDPDKIKSISTPKTRIVTTSKAAEMLSGNITIVKPGDSLEIDGIKIRAAYAYNKNKPFHTRGEYAGFVVEAEGKRIYYAGDTDVIPEMNRLQGLTVAMLPIGGTYTMTADESVDAIAAMKPKIVIPMHYNYIKGVEADAEKWKMKVEAGSMSRVVILEGGKGELEL